jgi:hypothetical protein
VFAFGQPPPGRRAIGSQSPGPVPIAKAAALDLINQVMATGQLNLAQAILQAISAVIPGINIPSLMAMLQSGNTNVLASAVPWDDVVMPKLSSDVQHQLFAIMGNAAQAEQSALFGTGKPGSGFTMKFDLLNPEAVAWVKQHGADLVKAIDEDQRAVLRGILEKAYVEGHTWKQVAGEIKTTVGLLPQHAAAVAKFQAQKIKDGMPATQAQQAADKYAAKLRAYRARNIARTETVRASTRGQQEVWSQAIEQGLIDESVARKQWKCQLPCPICAPLHNQTAPVKGTFAGGFFAPPDPHPSCKCVIVLLPKGPAKAGAVQSPPLQSVTEILSSIPDPAVKGPDGKPMLNAAAMKKVGGQGGSNPGGLYEQPDGTRWYIKEAPSEDHARNEVLTGRLYEAAGVDVPDLQYAQINGKIGVASKIQPLQKSTGAGTLSLTPGAKEGFAADAWLANWDVVGQGYDNLVVSHGKALRVDTGGGLMYRAQGAAKGAAFGPKVTEIQTLRDPSTNPQAAAVFGTMTPKQLLASMDKVAGVPDSVISSLVSTHFGQGIPSHQLKEKILARKADIIEQRNALAASLVTAPPKPAAVAPPPMTGTGVPVKAVGAASAPKPLKSYTLGIAGTNDELPPGKTAKHPILAPFVSEKVVYVPKQGYFVVPADFPMSKLPVNSYKVKPGETIKEPTLGFKLHPELAPPPIPAVPKVAPQPLANGWDALSHLPAGTSLEHAKFAQDVWVKVDEPAGGLFKLVKVPAGMPAPPGAHVPAATQGKITEVAAAKLLPSGKYAGGVHQSLDEHLGFAAPIKTVPVTKPAPATEPPKTISTYKAGQVIAPGTTFKKDTWVGVKAPGEPQFYVHIPSGQPVPPGAFASKLPQKKLAMNANANIAPGKYQTLSEHLSTKPIAAPATIQPLPSAPFAAPVPAAPKPATQTKPISQFHAGDVIPPGTMFPKDTWVKSSATTGPPYILVPKKTPIPVGVSVKASTWSQKKISASGAVKTTLADHIASLPGAGLPGKYVVATALPPAAPVGPPLGSVANPVAKPFKPDPNLVLIVNPGQKVMVNGKATWPAKAHAQVTTQEVSKGLPPGWKVSQYMNAGLADTLQKLPPLPTAAGIPATHTAPAVAPKVPPKTAVLGKNLKGEWLVLEDGYVHIPGEGAIEVKKGQALVGLAGSPQTLTPEQYAGSTKLASHGQLQNKAAAAIPTTAGDHYVMYNGAQQWVHVNAKGQASPLDLNKLGVPLGTSSPATPSAPKVKAPKVPPLPRPSSDVSLFPEGAHPHDMTWKSGPFKDYKRKAVWDAKSDAKRISALDGWRGSPDQREARMLQEAARLEFGITGNNRRAPDKSYSTGHGHAKPFSYTQTEMAEFRKMVRVLHEDTMKAFEEKFGADWRSKTMRLYRGVSQEILEHNMVDGWTSKPDLGFGGHSKMEEDVPLEQILIWWGHPNWNGHQSLFSNEFEFLRMRDPKSPFTGRILKGSY